MPVETEVRRRAETLSLSFQSLCPDLRGSQLLFGEQCVRVCTPVHMELCSQGSSPAGRRERRSEFSTGGKCGQKGGAKMSSQSATSAEKMLVAPDVSFICTFLEQRSRPSDMTQV